MPLIGLIGNNIRHSRSPEIWEQIFRDKNQEGYFYRLFQINGLEDLIPLIEHEPHLTGLNVTIPFKESIRRLLHIEDSVVGATCSCNTVRIQRGERLILEGFNTDAGGFESSVHNWDLLEGRQALIFGTGGAARSVGYVFKKHRISYRLVGRNEAPDSLSYSMISPELLSKTPILVNATPLGGPGFESQALPIPFKSIHKDHVLFDLLYHTPVTPFLSRGIEAGAFIQNGLFMLREQAHLASALLLD